MRLRRVTDRSRVLALQDRGQAREKLRSACGSQFWPDAVKVHAIRDESWRRVAQKGGTNRELWYGPLCESDGELRRSARRNCHVVRRPLQRTWRGCRRGRPTGEEGANHGSASCEPLECARAMGLHRREGSRALWARGTRFH
jgi:hypothetical protein